MLGVAGTPDGDPKKVKMKEVSWFAGCIEARGTTHHTQKKNSRDVRSLPNT